MPVNFKEACIRHYHDATYLKEDNRLPNAGHLYGLSAECGIKALIVSQGYATKSNGDLIDKNRNNKDHLKQHINKLSTTYFNSLVTFILNGRNGSKYMSMLTSLSNYYNWDVAHRYNDNQTQISSYNVGWEIASKEIMVMLTELIKDGVI